MLIGREHEKTLLQEALTSSRSELIAIYGRRRVGKTFLVREFLKRSIVLEVTGLHKGSMADQIENFTGEISKRFRRKKVAMPSNWLETFSRLEDYLNSLRSHKKKVIFIDEFPWMATARSKFLMAFENFWNHYCTRRKDLMVVICGSAASYMIQQIIRNKGGLHNRVTQKISLLPFTLHETKLFLESRNIRYTPYDILQVYMIMGGVPHYLEKLRSGRSVAQNIDKLCFEKDGLLKEEFNELYSSLFEDSDKHLAIIKALAASNKGITRQELIKKIGTPSGGDLSLKIEELRESGFITEYAYYGNKKQLSLYRLSDEYSRFYLKFVHHNKAGGRGAWQRLHKTQSYASWSGFCFETICLKHILQIKKALRIDAIFSTNSSWFNKNTQIDLLIDRDDNVINVCEMKFYNAPFSIDKRYYQNLKNKIAELQQETKTRKNIFLVMLTSHGLKENEYSRELVQNTLDMNILLK